jgi:hypothetical protein
MAALAWRAASTFGLQHAGRSTLASLWAPARLLSVGLPAMASAAVWQLRSGMEQALWLSPFVFASGKGKATIQSRKCVDLLLDRAACLPYSVLGRLPFLVAVPCCLHRA